MANLVYSGGFRYRWTWNDKGYHMEASNFVELGVVGMLGLLWFDLRNFRKSLSSYLTEDKHNLLCENKTLRIEAKIEETKQEILRELKNNRNHGG